MGPFSYIPNMQCNHAVFSVTHTINGSIQIKSKNQNETIHFQNDKGYIESDYGKSFPKKWIWLQCNNLKPKKSHNNNDSIMLSIAKIPFGLFTFTGFLSFFYINNKFYQFATYNFSSKTIKRNPKSNQVQIILKNLKNKVKITVSPQTSGNLKAPIHGDMVRSIKESIDSKIHIELYKKDKLLYEASGTHAGFEDLFD